MDWADNSIPYNRRMATRNAYTADALQDMHRRTHKCIRRLLKHCEELSEQELHRKLKGFGHATVHSQLFHLLAAEQYWIGVVQGRLDISMQARDYPAIKDYERYQRRLIRVTREYLATAGPGELNTARQMQTFQGTKKMVPAHIVTRVITHAFHHQAQVLAMCRYLGHPAPRGFDFPLQPTLK